MSDQEVNPIARSLMKSTSPRPPGKGGNVRRRVPIYKRGWFGALVVVTLIIGVTAFGMIMAILAPLQEQAEALDIADLQKIEVASRIMDRKGEEVGKIYVQNRTPIKVDDVPMHFIQALTSAEDSRYFQHSGVDVMGILRAIYLNYKAGEENQGASTITQQLARGAFDLKKMETTDKNSRYQRKIVEWFAAERIEKKYSKSEILEMYLNRIYFGAGFYGIQAASKGYFGKEVRDITLLESATLCGLIKSPNNLQPLRHPERSKKSRNHVLDRMYEEGYISKDERDTYSAQPVVTSPRTADIRLTYIYEEIRQQAIAIIGEEAAQIGGFNIYTSIDGNLQRTAEASVKKRMEEVESTPGYKHQTYSYYRALLDEYKKRINAKTIPEDTPKPQPEYLQTAVLAIDNRDGGVLAMVGGRDFVDSMFNRAVQSRRPAGTAFLPFVYATAFQSPEYFPPQRLKDGPLDNRYVMIGGLQGILGEWGTEQDARLVYGTSISAREALSQSRTAATARLGLELGLPAVKDLVAKAGIKSPLRDYPSSFLGASEVKLDEMCLAYSSFANKGKRPKQISIIHRITDHSGKVIFQVKQDEEVLTEAMDEVAAYQTHSCLVDALRQGTGKKAYDEYGLKDFPAAGKTGTHYEFKDLWFVGYTSAVTCGVWSGFDQQKQIYEGAFSNKVVLPMWADVMNASIKDFKPEEIQPPHDMQMVEVCRRSGLRALDTCYDKIPDPATGKIRAVRNTYREALRQRSNFDVFCDLHRSGERGEEFPGLGSASIKDQLITQSPEVANVSPVRMKGLTVLGADPYNTVQPVLRAEPVLEDGSTVQRAIPVEDPQEKTTPIKLAPPPPMKLD
ncbi:transglycosylase domain-containing protein [Verrucomicrobium sp. BvORR106]|uniref:transglycosylase domain-containing protein n=1 Tax=Verrucomicrobium sp. BvORR106 TaxID=1403819 RepID=UPI00056EC528|nr:transglycosylase domain-containing protein [Verrucomicrobium sp. BvORR106]